jgi:nucleoside-diphosphate-sugar epimerase
MTIGCWGLTSKLRFSESAADEFFVGDLPEPSFVNEVFSGMDRVRGRNSDNRLIQHKLGRRPSRPLEEGLVRTYEWIAQQVEAARESERMVCAD